MADRFLSNISQIQDLEDNDSFLIAKGDQLLRFSWLDFLNYLSNIEFNQRSSFLGKKNLTIQSESVSLILTDPNNLDGIINWLGTNKNTIAYSNPLNTEIVIAGYPTWGELQNLFDKNLSSFAYAFSGSFPDFILDLNNYEIKLSQIALYASNRTNYRLIISGSNDRNNWENPIEFTTPHSFHGWLILDLNYDSFFKHIKIEYQRNGGGNSWTAWQYEMWGDIRLNQNIQEGSLIYNLQLSDFNYLLEPNVSIGQISFLPLSTVGLNIGDRFYIHNPHSFELQGLPAPGDILQSSNGLDYISQGQTAEIVKVSDTTWFAY
ncbi:hypothetical protein [Cyanothece sp. BG0011]|uniref:hypothetical protein n=1 Tax=Cyanothece sp. BG0011 TaxID=2082950 RepID=UPI000D1F238A|nr:hypothetical protein [Cyanothece sp. BG0011]